MANGLECPPNLSRCPGTLGQLERCIWGKIVRVMYSRWPSPFLRRGGGSRRWWFCDWQINNPMSPPCLYSGWFTFLSFDRPSRLCLISTHRNLIVDTQGYLCRTLAMRLPACHDVMPVDFRCLHYYRPCTEDLMWCVQSEADCAQTSWRTWPRSS